MFKVNVGGQTFITSKHTLSKYGPNYFTSFFDYKPSSAFMFIDRNPQYFQLILDHIRGYSITLPTDEGELVRLYEDSHFYGIVSLIDILEESLGIRLNEQKRNYTKHYIISCIKSYNLKGYEKISNYIDKLADRELIDIRNRMNIIIKNINNQASLSKLHTGLKNITAVVEKQYNITGLTSAIDNDKTYEFLEQNRDTSIGYLLLLCSNINSNESVSI